MNSSSPPRVRSDPGRHFKFRPSDRIPELNGTPLGKKGIFGLDQRSPFAAAKAIDKRSGWIQTGRVSKSKPTKRLTLRDLADAVGLTPQAVSQALGDRKGTVKVSPATRERVRKVAAELGYRQDLVARALRYGRSGTLGVLGFRAMDRSFPEKLFYIFEGFKKLGLAPMVHLADAASEDSCRQACHALIDSRVDGVLLLSPPAGRAFTQSHVRLFQEQKIQVVSVEGTWIEDLKVFTHNVEDAFEKITLHLLEEGYRSITLMCSPIPKAGSSFHLKGTRTGFAKVQRKARRKGVQVDFRVCSPPSKFLQSAAHIPGLHDLYTAGYVGMWELIKRGEVPEALMCQVDNFALGALRACGEAKIRVPEEMALTGFGDHGETSAGYVPITTFINDLQTICHLAVEELAGLAAGTRKPEQRHVIVPGRLLVRQSSVRRPLAPLDY